MRFRFGRDFESLDIYRIYNGIFHSFFIKTLMRLKDISVFLFELLFNKSVDVRKKKIVKINYLAQVNRLSSCLEEASLQYLLSIHNFGLVLDIGANQGQYYDQIRNGLGYNGWIVSVEPNPRDFEILKETAGNDPKFIGINQACGSVPGSVTLHVMSDSKLSSIYQANDQFRERFYSDFSNNREITVNMTTVEEILNSLEIKWEGNIFLKTDTQGHDLEVLKGLGGFIDSIQAIQCEQSVIPIYDGVNDFTSLNKFLNLQNFSLFSSTPVLRDKMDQSIMEINAFYIRKRS